MRAMRFTWSHPEPARRNGLITSYNLTCFSITPGRESFLTQVYTVDQLDSYTFIVPNFRPVTVYTCQVFAINSAGRGPAAETNITTPEDGED